MFQVRGGEPTSGVRLPFVLEREWCPSFRLCFPVLPNFRFNSKACVDFYFCAPFVLLLSYFPDHSSLCFTLSGSYCCYENSSLQMRLIILENKIMFQLPSALNPLQSRSRVYFISLATHNIFNHKSYTLVDPLDVEECFQQLGFAFKELQRREIRFVLSVAGRTHAASPHYYSPHCSVLKTNKQNAKCVCMLKSKHFLDGRHLNIQILKIHVRNPSEVNKYLNIIQLRRSVCFSEMHIQIIPKTQKCARRITVEFSCFFLRASKEFLLG